MKLSRYSYIYFLFLLFIILIVMEPGDYRVSILLWLCITGIIINIISYDELGNYKLSIFRPMNCLLIFLLFNFISGPISHYLLSFYGDYYNYTTDYAYSFKILSIGTIGIFLGYYAWRSLLVILKSYFITRIQFSIADIDRQFTASLLKAEVLSIVFMLIAIIAMLIQFISSGIVPFFHIGDVDALRFELYQREGSGLYGRLVTFGLIGATGSLSLWQFRRFAISKCKPSFQNRLLIVVTVIYGTVLFLFGAKLPIFLPIVCSIANYNYFIKRIKLFKIRNIIIAFLLVLSMAIMTNLRAAKEAIVHNFAVDILVLFGIGRDTPRLLEYYRGTNDYYEINMINTVLVNALPKEVFSAFGYNKFELTGLDVNDLTGVKDVLGYSFVGGGACPGLLAELYGRYRVFGVVVGMFVIGVIFCILEQLLLNKNRFDLSVAFIYLITFNLVLFFQQGIGRTLDLFPQLYISLLFILFTRRGGGLQMFPVDAGKVPN